MEYSGLDQRQQNLKTYSSQETGAEIMTDANRVAIIGGHEQIAQNRSDSRWRL